MQTFRYIISANGVEKAKREIDTKSFKHMLEYVYWLWDPFYTGDLISKELCNEDNYRSDMFRSITNSWR